MKVINYTELRMNLKKYMDSVNEENELIIISRDNNRKSCVMISLDEYNKLTKIGNDNG